MGNSLVLDSVWYGFNMASMTNGQYNQIHDAAIAVKDQRIVWLGKRAELPDYQTKVEHDLNGGWVTPG